jgi:hypothetical protein
LVIAVLQPYLPTGLVSQDAHESQKTKHRVDLTFPPTSRFCLLFMVSRFSIVRVQEVVAGIPEMWITVMQATSMAVEYKPGMSVPLRAGASLVLIVRIPLALGTSQRPNM